MKKGEMVAYVRRIATSSVGKLQDVQVKIVEHILETKNVKQRMERMDYIADALFLIRKENVKATDDVWQLLIEQLFQSDQQLLMFDYYRHIICDDIYGKNMGFKDNLSYFNHGRNYVLEVFFRYIGSSIEADIKFCLKLFEIIHVSFAIANSGRESGNISEGLFKEGVYQAFHFFQVGMGMPKRKEIPVSLWFHTIIEHAWNNKGAAEVFRFIVDTMSDSGKKGIILKNLSNLSSLDCLELRTEDDPVIGASSYDELQLIKKLIARISEKGAALRQESEKMLAWFTENRELININTNRKRLEILEKPSRGLRSGGADYIEINISTLFSNGIRSVVFYPENCTFPNLRIEIMYLKWTPHLVPVSCELTDMCLQNFINSDDDAHTIVKDLLEAVIVDVLHRIIVTSSVAIKKEEQKSKLKAHDCEVERAFEVRPHFRKLPGGWQASVKAKEMAGEKFGWTLPPGKTFVQGHYRNGQIDYQIKTSPIMVYDDEFFQEIV
jgi:hypothetical protein